MNNLINEIKYLKGNCKGIFFLVAFRISSAFTKNKMTKIIGFPIRILYKLNIQWVLGIDIDDSTKIGKCFNVYHGQSLIINKGVVIGSNVIVRHNTTIGNSRNGGDCPIIGNNVEIGANSVIIGKITIGNNSIIAAGSVVITDVPPNSLVAGNPAKVKRIIDEQQINGT